MLKIICFSIRIKFLYGINYFAKTHGAFLGSVLSFGQNFIFQF